MNLNSLRNWCTHSFIFINLFNSHQLVFFNLHINVLISLISTVYQPFLINFYQLVLSTFYQLYHLFNQLMSMFYQLFINIQFFSICWIIVLLLFIKLYIYMYICFINFLLFCQLVIIFVNCYQLFFNCLSTGLSNVYQLVICFIVLSYCYQLLPTVYQLFINFYQLFINFYQLFINFLSTKLSTPPTESTLCTIIPLSSEVPFWSSEWEASVHSLPNLLQSGFVPGCTGAYGRVERIVFNIVLVSSFSTTTHAKILSTPFEFLWGGTWLEEAICVVNSFSLVLV